MKLLPIFIFSVMLHSDAFAANNLPTIFISGNESAYPGESTTFICHVNTAGDLVTFQWVRIDGNNITHFDESVDVEISGDSSLTSFPGATFFYNSTFNVSNVNYTDNGVGYYCNASGCNVSITAYLTVLSPLIMSFTPFSQLFLNVDDDGSLICDALGGPRLVITILRDGTVVENGIMGDSRVVYNFTASNNSFGNYTCIATIDDMEANESTLVVVAPYNTTITATDSNGELIARPAVVEYGNMLTLTCSVSGGPANAFSWTKDNMVIGSTNILIISAVNLADGGEYECIVSNAAGSNNASITIYGPVILSSGGNVENGSMINNFVNNGTDFVLSLICTSINQNETVEWIMLNNSDTSKVELSNDSNSRKITFVNPTVNFTSVIRCKSRNISLYKDVTVIERNPFHNLLTNRTIYAPLASSPVISIFVAIDSDGTISQQNNVTESLVLTGPNDIFVGELEQDSTNFQLYHFMFLPLQRQNMGQYVISSEIYDDQQVEIEVVEIIITTEVLNITTPFTSVTQLVGRPVILSCFPSVNEAVLLWTHNGAMLFEDENTSFLPINLNHNLILDNTDIDDSGQYTCRAVLNDEVVEQSITVFVVPVCASNFSGALFWNSSRRNLTVTQPCSALNPNFRSGVSITRRCNNDGTWSPVDVTACTMSIVSNPVIAVHFTVAFSDSSTMDSTTTISNVLKQIPLNDTMVNPFNNTWSYESDSKSLLLSFLVSFDLQSIINLSATLVNDIKNNLRMNVSSIIPSGFMLTDEGFMVSGFQPNLSCPCTDTSGDLVRSVCFGPSTAPCMCSSGGCTCNKPTYIGDGRVCRLDSDNDGIPDEKDDCPNIYSVFEDGEQSDTFCSSEANFDGGCPFGPDEVWNIIWPATSASRVAIQKCPGLIEAEGNATRLCNQNGDWEAPNVSQCRTVEQIRLEMRAEELNTLVVNTFLADERDLTVAFMPEVVEEIADELNEITNTSAPLLPNDVISTANTLNIIISVTNITINEVDQPLISNVIEDAVDILDTLLDPRNDGSFQNISVQSLEEENATEASVSEELLLHTEQVGILLVSTLDTNNNKSVRTISNPNIVIEARIPTPEDLEGKESIQFPAVTNMSTNLSLMFDNMTPMIEIPSAAIVFRQLEEGREVPVINIVSRNSRLPTNEGQRIESVILSSQISTDPQTRVSLGNNTVQLTFNIGMQGNTTQFNPQCAFFRFSSNGNESGEFLTDGITQSSTTNSTFVQCTSTHLTSFAVLVDTSGRSSDTEALSIVSYIGCAISIACLLFTIAALITLRKKVFNKVQHFLHLNLSLALLLGLATFVSGIETASEYRASCLIVAILLHYFFMAAFSWMLCEGLFLFITLYFVFYNGFFKHKKFFFAVGWGLPIPIVAVSAAVSHEYYGINDRCWISEDNGTIWAFIGPMLLILLINTFFLVAILYRIYKSKQQDMTVHETSINETVKALLKAAAVVTPILGCTWVFGLLAINENTVAFAWIFTILNSLQGVFIMFFYIFRDDKFLKLIKCQKRDSRSSRAISSSDKIDTRRTAESDSKTLSQYNEVVRNKYVIPSSYIEEDYKQVHFVSPNIFNFRAGVDSGEFDELEFENAEQQESIDLTPAHRATDQQSTGSVYVNQIKVTKF